MTSQVKTVWVCTAERWWSRLVLAGVEPPTHAHATTASQRIWGWGPGSSLQVRAERQRLGLLVPMAQAVAAMLALAVLTASADENTTASNATNSTHRQRALVTSRGLRGRGLDVCTGLCDKPGAWVTVCGQCCPGSTCMTAFKDGGHGTGGWCTKQGLFASCSEDQNCNSGICKGGDNSGNTHCKLASPPPRP